jgi:hypothetical protein
MTCTNLPPALTINSSASLPDGRVHCIKAVLTIKEAA